MPSDDLLTAARLERRRRETTYLLTIAAVVVAAVPAFFVLPRWSPQSTLLGAGVVATYAFASLYAERSDAWQRGRALLAFAAGGLAALTVLLVQVAMVAADAGHRTTAVYPLRVFLLVWLGTDIMVRAVPNLRSARQ